MPHAALTPSEAIQQRRLDLPARVISHCALDVVGTGGWSGAKIYDALLLQCAARQKVKRIYTFNLADLREELPGSTAFFLERRATEVLLDANKKPSRQNHPGVCCCWSSSQNSLRKRSLRMKCVWIAAVVFSVGTLAVMGQRTSNTDNNGPGNIRNNFSQGPRSNQGPVNNQGPAPGQGTIGNTTPAQTNKTINNSRSNIKDNLVISLGPNGKTVCTILGKAQACTAEDVMEINRALVAPGTMASDLKSVTLAQDGTTLNCVTKAGRQQPCVAVQLKDLNDKKEKAVASKGISGS